MDTINQNKVIQYGGAVLINYHKVIGMHILITINPTTLVININIIFIYIFLINITVLQHPFYWLYLLGILVRISWMLGKSDIDTLSAKLGWRNQSVCFAMLYKYLIDYNITINIRQFYMQDKVPNLEEKSENQRTTADEQEKRCRLIEKLVSHNAQCFRQIDINQYDLNITENFADLEAIDDLVTPLIYCAHFGLKEICRHLLKNKKVDIDLETANNKQTPLTVACMRGNYEIVRLLVLANAQINKPNALNQSPLTAIIYRLADQPISFENTCICFRIADFLVDHGADVNWIVDKARGYSLLHYFCSIKVKMNNNQRDLNFRIIKFLLEKGADVNQKTLKDQTCMELIESHCNKQAIQVLLQQYKGKGVTPKIVKHNIKRLGSGYFKVQNLQTN